MALYKLCGCGKKIPYGQVRCDECQIKYEERQKERHKEYKANRNDKKEQQFYKSKEWEAVKKIVKQRDHGLCRLCLEEHRITYYQTVHHIVEVKEDFRLALNPNNCICLCERHHQQVHREYEKDKLSKFDMQSKLSDLAEGG